MLNICLFGPRNSGKTSYVCSVRSSDKQNINKTVGVQFSKHTVEIQSQNYVMQYWDICGKKSYSHMIHTFAKSCDLALFFLTAHNSLKEFHQWSEKLKGEKIKIYVVFNKRKAIINPQIVRQIKQIGWNMLILNAHEEQQCKALQRKIIFDNIPKCKEQPKTTKLKKNLFPVVGAIIGLSCLLAFKLLHKGTSQ